MHHELDATTLGNHDVLIYSTLPVYLRFDKEVDDLCLMPLIREGRDMKGSAVNQCPPPLYTTGQFT